MTSLWFWAIREHLLTTERFCVMIHVCCYATCSFTSLEEIQLISSLWSSDCHKSKTFQSVSYFADRVMQSNCRNTFSLPLLGDVHVEWDVNAEFLFWNRKLYVNGLYVYRLRKEIYSSVMKDRNPKHSTKPERAAVQHCCSIIPPASFLLQSEWI